MDKNPGLLNSIIPTSCVCPILYLAGTLITLISKLSEKNIIIFHYMVRNTSEFGAKIRTHGNLPPK